MKKRNLSIKNEEEQFYLASQWQLMWRNFKKHKLAIMGIFVLIIIYCTAIGAQFFATQDIYKKNSNYVYAPPQKIHFIDQEGNFHLRPFVYGLDSEIDFATMTRNYKENKNVKYYLYFIVRGDKYKFWRLFNTDVHFVGVNEPGVLFLFGSDKLGRDLFSRVVLATRISVSIGLVGVFLSFILGSILGGISGYYGGKIDMLIQRIIEFFLSLPTIPLWMALSAALPSEWPPLKIYFGIVIVLSFIGWVRLARVVRGKFIELREEDFVVAAKVAGSTDIMIILTHLLPSFLSYLIVSITLAIPGMILGETALSFLGLGLRPPVVSWGTLLQAAQNFRSIALYPWLLIPGIFVIITVLGFNFLGDGLRDAADPYSR